MNLHLLRLFAAVASHNSFSRAAQALHVSQPAVSKGVRELEAQLGSRLLERGPDGVRPTPAGAVLAGHARVLFAAERAAEEDLDAFRGLRRGSLSVGASTTIAIYLLPSILGTFHKAHPDIELRLTSANTQAIASLMTHRELDVALVEGPVADPAMVAEPWRREEMVLIAPPDHRLLQAPGAAVDALADEILLVREPGSGTREVVATALTKRGVTLKHTLEVGSTEAIKQMVAAGVGVAIVSAAAAADQIALGKLRVVPLQDFTLHRWLNRLTVVGRPANPAAVVFGRMLTGEDREPVKA